MAFFAFLCLFINKKIPNDDKIPTNVIEPITLPIITPLLSLSFGFSDEEFDDKEFGGSIDGKSFGNS